MKIIAPIIEFYEPMLKNNITEELLSTFNEKEKLLFKEVIKGKVVTDKQASKLLYDGNPSGQAYAKFKQGFLQKLLHIVINFNNDLGSKHRQKVIDLQKDYLAMHIMLTSSMKETAKELGRKLIIQAERLYQYDIAMALARLLGGHYWITKKNKRIGQKYWDKFDEFSAKYMTNAKIVKYYSELMLMAKKKDYNESLHMKATEYEQVVKKLATPDNPKSMQFYYQIVYAKYASISEHAGVIENNLKAIQYFESLPHEFQSAKDLLKIQLIVSYLNIGKYEEAVPFLSIESQDIGDEKWMEKMGLKIRIYLNLGKFTEAGEIVDEILNSIRFKQTFEVRQQEFWLYKYYVDLMLYYDTGKSVNTRRIKNNMTRLNADKRGFNISYIIANMIEVIQSKGIKEIYKYEEKLRNYVKAHLNNTHNERAKTFFKFILSLPLSIYDKERFENKLSNYKNELEENPSALTTKPDNEMIPYESLMKTILDEHVYVKSTQKVATSSGQAASDN